MGLQMDSAREFSKVTEHLHIDCGDCHKSICVLKFIDLYAKRKKG